MDPSQWDGSRDAREVSAETPPGDDIPLNLMREEPGQNTSEFSTNRKKRKAVDSVEEERRQLSLLKPNDAVHTLQHHNFSPSDLVWAKDGDTFWPAVLVRFRVTKG
jgi:hypothetical protein